MNYNEKQKLLDDLRKKGVLKKDTYEERSKKLASKLAAENEQIEREIEECELKLVLLENGLFSLNT